jgi:hypothetical protein
MKGRTKLIAILFFFLSLATILILYTNENRTRTEAKVRVSATPNFSYSYDSMKPGVIQHVDREYTYDYIPAELENGLLFQGIHRPVKGTSIVIEIFRPTTIYFFFQNTWDGGYSEIFSNLKEWEKCTETPQYDISNGDHGLHMTMYKLKASRGNYTIPPTTAENACFNIVFQFN